MKADIITCAINALRDVYEREKSYREINDKLRALQGDFYTNVQYVDDVIYKQLIVILDAVLCDNASYWLWECSQNGSITHKDGTKYDIKTIADIEAYARQFSPYAGKKEVLG